MNYKVKTEGDWRETEGRRSIEEVRRGIGKSVTIERKRRIKPNGERRWFIKVY